MGRLLSDFGYSLVGDDDPNRIESYGLIYLSLIEGSHPLPVKPVESVTYAELLLHLQTLAGGKLKEEVLAHPEYYGGHGAFDIKDMFFRTFPDDYDGPFRNCVAWWRIPCTPNWITEADVVSSLE